MSVFVALQIGERLKRTIFHNVFVAPQIEANHFPRECLWRFSASEWWNLLS